MSCSLSNDVQNRQIRFEIIKYLHSSATMFNRRNLEYSDLANNLKHQFSVISIQIRTLLSLGYVFEPFPSYATLTQRAMNVMERIPQPRNYDEFVEMFNNPEHPFGEAVRIEGPRGNFWEDHPFIKKITPIGSFITIIAFVLWIIFTFFVGK